MKRDWDTIRELLSQIEDESLPDFVAKLHREVQFGKGDAVFESVVARHLKLLVDAGYVTGIQFSGTAPGMVGYGRIEPELTMEGYDLLEVLRLKRSGRGGCDDRESKTKGWATVGLHASTCATDL